MTAFTEFLRARNDVTVFDVDSERARKLAESRGVKQSASLGEALRGADVAILCTPISATPTMIKEAAEHLPRGSVLSEIASLKENTVPALREAAVAAGVQPLSLHPMFGPGPINPPEQTFAVVSVIDAAKETELSRELFPGFHFIEVDAATHDESMAAILALPYFLNIAFAASLPRGGEKLLPLAGTTFRAQLALTHCVVGEDPELIESLINGNRRSRDAIDAFIDEARFYRRLLKADPERFRKRCSQLKATFSVDPTFSRARDARRVFLEELTDPGRGAPPSLDASPAKQRL